MKTLTRVNIRGQNKRREKPKPTPELVLLELTKLELYTFSDFKPTKPVLILEKQLKDLYR